MEIYFIISLALAVFTLLHLHFRELGTLVPHQISKTAARVLFATCYLGAASALGILIYLMILMERFRAALRQTVVAMNNPERLAQFEQVLYQDRLITGLILTAILVVAALNIWIGLKMITTRLRERGDSSK